MAAILGVQTKGAAGRRSAPRLVAQRVTACLGKREAVTSFLPENTGQ
nr:MAG TPA: hypothetical protein [Caudoviricetes sp.]